MAYDLKSATPDASFGAGTFLFGADSQSATDPSVYGVLTVFGYLLSLANTWTAAQTFTPPDAATTPVIVKGFASQSAPLQSWRNSSNTVLASIAANGDATFGATFTTPTGGVWSQPSVIEIVSGGHIRWLSRARLYSDSARTLTLYDSSATDAVSFNVEAANVLALRSGTSAQTINSYYSYTDASNYQRAALKTASGSIEVAAESAGTGAANIDLKLTTKGTGVVQYGTHSAIAAETVTGYITIKDSGGTSRKLAVVS